MRVAWFTPLSQRTGISKYSLSAATALSQHAQVEVWTSPQADDYSIDLPVHDIDELSSQLNRLSTYDIFVYNMGNNPTLHAQIFEVYERHPGVVIQHDKTMAHFMRVVLAARDPFLYQDVLAHYCGESAASMRQALGLESPEREAPLLEPCLWNAMGAVVHASDSVELVDRYPGVMPVAHVDLPFSVYDPAERQLSRRDLSVPEECVLVVAHGFVGESKRIEAVLDAIALLEPDTRRRMLFAVVGGGHPGYMRKLRRRAEALGLAFVVRFTGRVDDQTMHSYLRQADAFVNLRFPSTESASASLVEELHFGGAAIVSDIGFYSSFPDDVVLKTPPTDPGPAIAAALEGLIMDSGMRQAYADRAREYARTRFARKTYGERLFAFLSAIADEKGEALARLDALTPVGVGLTREKVEATIVDCSRVWLSSNINPDPIAQDVTPAVDSQECQ